MYYAAKDSWKSIQPAQLTSFCCCGGQIWPPADQRGMLLICQLLQKILMNVAMYVNWHSNIINNIWRTRH